MPRNNRGNRPYLRLVDGTYRTPPRKIVRVQLDFSDEAKRRLNEILALSGRTSNAELIRDALLVYEWVLKVRRSGKDLEIATPVKLFGFRLFERTERIFVEGR